MGTMTIEEISQWNVPKAKDTFPTEGLILQIGFERYAHIQETAPSVVEGKYYCYRKVCFENDAHILDVRYIPYSWTGGIYLTEKATNQTITLYEVWSSIPNVFKLKVLLKRALRLQEKILRGEKIKPLTKSWIFDCDFRKVQYLQS